MNLTTLVVHHKVQDYSAWRKVFDDLTTMRTGHKGYQSPSDPNEITVFTDWKDIDKAKAYAASPDLKEGMKNAGVISQPDVMFLAEV